MGSRTRRAELGRADAQALARVAASELREARLAAGISQATAARAVGLSRAGWGRLERSEDRSLDLLQVCCAARALGLRASLKLYPEGQPVRDAPQLALFMKLGRVAAAPLRVSGEIGLPIIGDPRAWDASIEGDGPPCFADLETHVTDAQAVERRLRLKQRDDPRAGTILLVLLRSDHHRRFLAEYREVFRDLLPLDGPPILRALRAGRRPPGSGIVLL